MTALKKITITAAFVFFSSLLHAQELNGSYSGTLEVQGMQLELILNFEPTADGYTGTLDVPAQGATGIGLDSVLLEGNTLTVTAAKLGMTYTGTVSGGSIEGTYEQMGQKLPLTLMKTIKTKPGNTALPSTDAELAKIAAKAAGNYKYTVEDYFKTPEAFAFRLSPDGNYISYLKRRETGERDLFLQDTETQKEALLIEQQEDVIRGFFWANNNRILYLQDKGGNENHHVFGVDITGENKKELTPYEGVKVNIIEELKEDD